jgi:hypothetical protein
MAMLLTAEPLVGGDPASAIYVRNKVRGDAGPRYLRGLHFAVIVGRRRLSAESSRSLCSFFVPAR